MCSIYNTEANEERVLLQLQSSIIPNHSVLNKMPVFRCLIWSLFEGRRFISIKNRKSGLNVELRMKNMEF